jgi:hypothetical protein
MSDGTIIAWGDDGYRQCTGAGYQTDIVRVKGGWVYTAGLKSDGTVAVWGSAYPNSPVLVVPPDLSGVVDVSIGQSGDGGYFALALKSDGSLAAWGNNSGGVCDIPAEATGIAAARAVPPASRSVAIRSDQAILIWPSYEGAPLFRGWLEGPAIALAASYTHFIVIAGDAEATPAEGDTLLDIGSQTLLYPLRGGGRVCLSTGTGACGHPD